MNRIYGDQNRKKTNLTIAVGSFLLICLSSCNPNTTSTNPTAINPSPSQTSYQTESKKVILTTFTVLADIAQNVAGDQAIIESLTKPGSEIHGYEPTPSDLTKASKADLILDNGLGLERWAERFYGSLKDVPHVTLSFGVTPVLIADDAYAGKPNPHAWMSPQNALVYVENIRKALIKLDPANEAYYTANAATYSQQIREIDQKLRQEIAALPPNKRYMVTCEGAFSYIIQDYGLKELYLWPVNAENQGTPQQIRKVIDEVKTNKIPTIFCESTVSAESQKQVAAQTGAKFGGVFYVDSLSAADGVAPTYLKLLDYNINTLIKGLQEG
ncbi:metal ABC transporter substrate-binding protein [Aphanothece hegewaldii CCALA 016]|uniref:Metal ABC transporter substrate-binding protein n=1 Tax=Aphanothece hegewaldii CCALA 016 TaxID=2107694 RepID=A0A2T1LUI2_9CHRO|nr:metal ABC transporter substrate-binding protein [Aphanothece hegewaldii]PSF35154.1 metal ABC transporter substrate-binding protein [Aphanothece hegewaldii CCALA 016]